MYGDVMRGLLIQPFGKVAVIENVTKSDLRRLVGEQHSKVSSKDGNLTIFTHELCVVADLPINAHISLEAGMVIGGPVVVIPKAGSASEKSVFLPTYEALVLKQCQDKDLVTRLQAVYEANISRGNFRLHDGGQWLYYGRAFEAFVVSESSEHMKDQIPRYDVRIYSAGETQPFNLQIVEYSLREVLEAMILDDENTAKGNPPDHFKTILRHFGRSK